MKISEEFPSQYIKASDLGGREIRVTMQNVERELIGSDKKLVLYFKGKQKGLVLNKTNAATIGDAYGDDTDDWYDQPLILFSIKTDFQGKVVDGLRCRVPTAKDNKPAPRREPQQDAISGGAEQPRRVVGGISDNMDQISSGPVNPRTDMDDEIPFAAEFR